MTNAPLPPRALALALGLLAALALAGSAEAQNPDGFNYDETNVPDYTLPDPLTFDDGSPVTDAEGWRSRRRGEVLELFRSHVYGRAPVRPEAIRFEDGGTIPDAVGGKATRKRVLIHLGDGPEPVTIDLALYVPNSGTGPSPRGPRPELRREPRHRSRPPHPAPDFVDARRPRRNDRSPSSHRLRARQERIEMAAGDDHGSRLRRRHRLLRRHRPRL